MRKPTPSTLYFSLKGLVLFFLFSPGILFSSELEEAFVLEIQCPPDLTLECDGNYSSEIFAWLTSATATNMCDAPVTIKDNLDELDIPFLSCDAIAGVTVRFIATDLCSGNSDTCFATIFIDDTKTPSITCPADLILECDGDYGSQITTWLESVQATDECDTEVVVTNDYVGGLPEISCDQSAGLPVTFTAIDDCGNTAKCTATILLDDNDPSLTINCPGDLVLNCDGIYGDEINAWLASVTVTDDCGLGITISNDYTFGDLPDLSCNMLNGLPVVFMATDACGGVAQCEAALIIIDDNMTPSMTCPENLILICDGDYTDEINAWLTTIIATDACDDDLDITNDYVDGSLPDITCLENPMDSLRVRFFAEDDCENGSFCNAYILLIDTSNPTIDCEEIDNLVLECVEGADYPSQIEAWIDANTAILLNGTIVDDLCNNGILTVEDDYNGSSIPELSCNLSTGLPVTFTVSDGCGNSAMCTKTVYLDDSEAPIIDCSGVTDLVLECTNGVDFGPQIQTWLNNAHDLILLNSMDACGGVLMVANDYDDPEDFPAFSCDPLAGTLVTFTLSDECGNESDCSARIKYTDTTDPIIACPNDLYLECGGTDHASLITVWLASFSASDACDDNLTVSNDYIDGTFPDLTCRNNPSNSIEVVFSAQDDCNPVVSCSAFIFLVDETDPVIDCSGVNDLVLECMDGADYASLIESWIADSKVAILAASSDVCDNDLDIEDDYDGSEVPPLSCDLSTGLTITFIVSDDCGNSASCEKKVFLDDSIDPVLADAPDDITVLCGDPVPDPADLTATDLCDTDVEILFEADTTLGVPVIIERTWTAVDDCGNEDEDTQILTLEDFDPQAICKQITVTLSGDPTLHPAEDFDDGSFSLCSDVIILARRLDSPHCEGDDSTPFAETVPFFCCDAGHNVTVELEVTDAFGRSDTCAVEIPVEVDDIPVITCPPAVTVECDDCTLENTGVATAEDGCDDAEITFFDGDLDNCNVGTFIRTWIATNSSGKADTCEQLITLINSTPFNINDIQWPVDVTIENECTIPDDTGEPEYVDGICELISHAISDEFDISPAPGCTVRIREWTVFDFCQLAPQGSDCPGGIMCWTHTQTIELINNIPPEITCTPPDDFCSYDPECLTGEATLSIEATDDCNSLLFYYKIDYHDDGTIDIGLNSDDDGTVSGTFIIGTHRITWKVDDGCGNVVLCDYLFTIKDCLAPILTTFDLQSAEINPGQGVEYWATDWVVSSSSYDYCGELAEFLIRVPSLGIGQTVPPVDATSSYTFTCDDLINLGPEVQVDLWVRDTSFNWTYTTPMIELEDNMEPYCSGIDFAVVTGIIENEEGETVEHVQVTAEGSGMAEEVITDSDGLYSFDLPIENNYNISAERNDDLLNGVSTLDLILMNKHILQVDQLDSPYKMIAADINNSGFISVTDMVHLRKAILYITTEFPNNGSWRFIDADFVFPNPDNPFESPFPEVLTFNDLALDDDTKFVAVKVGDTNCSAQTNELLGEGDDRNQGDALILITADKSLKADESYTIEFRADNFSDLFGFQFSFFFDPSFLTFEGIMGADLSGLDRDNFGLNKLSEGLITCSWNSLDQPVRMEQDQVIFSFNFKAEVDIQLSDAIHLNSYYTRKEAYKSDQIIDIDLQFSGENQLGSKDPFELFQNFPNPFTDETTIAFKLYEAGEATLLIYDISGNLVQQTSSIFSKGYNEITIDRETINSKGVFYYQLESAGDFSVKRMIISD